MGRHAHCPPKDLREMARTRVADFERDFDEAAAGFSDQLLCLQHALAGHQLMRRHPLVFFVLGIFDSLQKFVVAPDAATVFRRTGVLSIQANRILLFRVIGKNLLDH